jgi:hypothetical protein
METYKGERGALSSNKKLKRVETGVIVHWIFYAPFEVGEK